MFETEERNTTIFHKWFMRVHLCARTNIHASSSVVHSNIVRWCKVYCGVILKVTLLCLRLFGAVQLVRKECMRKLENKIILFNRNRIPGWKK